MKTNKLLKIIVLAPVIFYAIILILFPILYILGLSFLKSDSYGGIINTFTLENYLNLANSIYILSFLKSFLIGGITTIICIVISFPFAYFLSKQKESLKNFVYTLVILPFLTNSLIRMYGWIILLRKSGIINATFLSMGFLDKPMSLMYNNFGIVLGMVYTLLPYMIMPLFSACEKLDKRLIEASYDLGASKFQTLKNVILPGIKTGLFNGSLMVLIPSIGYFFISDILGGGKLMLIGNLIKNQFYIARNWPFGSAIAIILIIITFILIHLYKKTGGKMDDLGGA